MPKLSAHSLLNAACIPSGFIMPETIEGNFVIEPAFLNLIERNQFGGNITEDPTRHIRIFTDYCSIIKQTGITQDQIRKMFFPFSLRDRAREWIADLDQKAAGITDWNSLALAFYQKYYRPERTNRMRSQITGFQQLYNESLSEAWERYKRTIRECPHHGLSTWLVVMTFYNGLYFESRAILDSAANGRFADNTDDDKAWTLIEEMAMHTSHYSGQRGVPSRTPGSNDHDILNTVMTQLSTLSKRVESLHTGTSASMIRPVHATMGLETLCGNCRVHGNHTSECVNSIEQVDAYRSWRPNTPYSPPRSPSPQNELAELRAMLQQSLTAHTEQQSTISQILTAHEQLKNQVAQLASPMKELTKPKECLDAITLRSGTNYEGPKRPGDGAPISDDIPEAAMKGID
ncbi:hypothetical protein vseg_015164 [Gypsophila vaccaria]